MGKAGGSKKILEHRGGGTAAEHATTSYDIRGQPDRRVRDRIESRCRDPAQDVDTRSPTCSEASVAVTDRRRDCHRMLRLPAVRTHAQLIGQRTSDAPAHPNCPRLTEIDSEVSPDRVTGQVSGRGNPAGLFRRVETFYMSDARRTRLPDCPDRADRLLVPRCGRPRKAWNRYSYVINESAQAMSDSQWGIVG